MINSDFQLTQDDYAEAQVSHFTSKLGRRFFWVMLLSAAALLVMVANGLVDPTKAREMAAPGIFFATMLLLMAWLRSGMLYRRQFNRLKPLQQTIHFEAGESGIVYRTSKGESTTRWEGFERWRESTGCFLLYVQPRLFFVVPKRVLNSEQVATFRELLRSRIH